MAIGIGDIDTFRLTGNTERDLATLKAMPQMLADVLLTRRRQLREIAGDRMLSQEGKETRTHTINEGATAAAQRLAETTDTA